MKWWDQIPYSFFECWVLSQFFHSPLLPTSRGSLVPLHFLPKWWCHLHIWGYWYFSWKSWIPACTLSSLDFLMIYSVYKLNKQSDNIQSWRTPFPTWNQFIMPCPVLTVVSWHAHRLLRRQVRWSGITISLTIFHSLLWSTQRLWYSQWSRNWCFSGILMLFLWSSRCCQFNLWFLCFF